MAHFRGTVQGGRTEASRLGHKSTGLTVTANGWTAGLRIIADCPKATDGNQDSDCDRFDVYMTDGSSPKGRHIYIGSVYAPSNGDSGPAWVGVNTHARLGEDR